VNKLIFEFKTSFFIEFLSIQKVTKIFQKIKLS